MLQITTVLSNYDFSWAVLNAKDYGIPQNRERVFVVGFRHDLKVKNSFEFPSVTKNHSF